METNEFKAQLQEVALEVKKDISALEAKTNADLLTVQGSLDAIAAEQKRASIANEGEVKATLVTVLETKSNELNGFTSKGAKAEFKASVDMLRSNTGDSLDYTSRGAYVALPNRLTHVRDFMRIGKLATPVYSYDRELPAEGKPALTAEGTRKPRVSFSSVAVVANAAKIAMHYKLSSELAHDRPALAYSFQGRGIEMTLQEEDYQLLYGAGTAGTIQGIMPLATEFNPGSLRVTSAQNIDVIRAAVAQVRKSMYRANVVFMNPTDVAALELTKDEDGRYILPNIMTAQVSTVARIQIAEIDAIAEGEFLVGALDLAVDTFMIEDLRIDISNSNEDDFVNNKITVLIEERLIQAVTRPTALVKGEFESAKVALSVAQA